ncbi:MAG: response regulator [Ruminococcus sp.]
MPRLDGIQMLEQLETILPDVVPVFMSGYSDKEYLKAAIKLKAVNYIEKPLDPAGNPGCRDRGQVIFAWKKADPTQCVHPFHGKRFPPGPSCSPSLTLTQRKVLTSCMAELSLSISPYYQLYCHCSENRYGGRASYS